MSGEEAVEKAGELRPDLVLMDICLEGDMDGVQAAALVRERFHIPVVYLTAYSNQDILNRANVTEPFGYILKPYEDRELHVAVETALYKHRTDRKLQESERRYRTTLNSVGDGIIAIDSEGRVILLNPVAERITGWNQADAAGQPLDAIFPLVAGKDRASVTNPAHSALRDNSVHHLIPNCLLVTRNGREVLVEDSAAPLNTDGHEGPTVAVLAFRDVTEQRRMEAAFQQAQKLESLGLLAGGIAHDFNNLLTPVLGYAELLKLRVGSDPEAVQMIESIMTAANTAAQLTGQMLAYAGKGRLLVMPLDLSIVVRKMAGLLSASVSKKAELLCDLPDDLPAIEVDPSQVQQVVLNLLTNASESLAATYGVVQVSTRVVTATAADLASRFVPEPPIAGDYVVLEVSDTGCGMSEETLSRIFDPFFSTKSTGRGLGLAALLGIVRGHRGTVKVRSVPGQGTTFEVFFPCSSQKAITNRPESFQAEPVQGIVLVAEDEEGVRTLVEQTLARAGLQVVLVRDGQEAVDVYAQRREEIGCVLLDLTMPRLSGSEALAEIRLIDPTVPVVIMSGFSEEGLASQFAGTPLVGTIQKPFRPGQLLDLMRTALMQRK